MQRTAEGKVVARVVDAVHATVGDVLGVGAAIGEDAGVHLQAGVPTARGGQNHDEETAVGVNQWVARRVQAYHRVIAQSQACTVY